MTPVKPTFSATDNHKTTLKMSFSCLSFPFYFMAIFQSVSIKKEMVLDNGCNPNGVCNYSTNNITTLQQKKRKVKKMQDKVFTGHTSFFPPETQSTVVIDPSVFQSLLTK